MKTRASFLLSVLAAMIAASAMGRIALPAMAAEIDSGRFKIYLQGRSMGVEDFYFDVRTDSAIVLSTVRELVRSPAGDTDSLKKSCQLMVNAFDLDLRSYHSSQSVHGQTIRRSLSMSDTSFTSAREIGDHGEADILVRPPGRIYVHDPELYVLFDVISRNLHTQSFDSRPITLMVLGARDTTVEITARRLATAPLRWGARTIQAERLELDDGVNRILMWSDPRGRLIKLEQLNSGLVVLRDAAPVRPARRRPKTG